MISIIAAVSEDLGLGRNNDLLWYIPEDLKRFKRLTYGKTVVMGKRTWESLPLKPLPGRKNIVISDITGDSFENALTACSIEDAMDKCGHDGEIFIIGGASIYRQFMPYAGRLYITHVHMNKPADVFFPEIDMSRWKVVEREEYRDTGQESIPYSYIVYERKEPGS